MNNKTNMKLEAFVSDGDQSNENTSITELHIKNIKIESTSANEYETDSKMNIKAEINVSDIHLDHERECFYNSNPDFEMDSKIIIKEEPVILEAELPNVEYLDMSLATKLENDTVARKDKRDTKIQSIKQDFVSDIFSQNDKKCFSADLVIEIKKDNINCSDTDVETIKKQETNFQSEVASFSDGSQENANVEGDLENKEATSSESPRFAVNAVDHYFKPDSANGVNKETSMRANTCSRNCAPPSVREHLESVKTMHDASNVLYNCNICGESISSPLVSHSQLTSHICEERFKQKSPLKIDPLVHSSRKESYKCDTCGKVFKQFQGLKRHKLIHSDTKPYKCEQCGKCFRQIGALNQHNLLHSGSIPYKCKHCDKCFRHKKSLNEHKLLHLDSNRFKCGHCGKCFTSKAHLNEHKLLHSGSKPYKCEHCGKCFISKSKLNQHEFLHSDPNPFKCEQCGKFFRQKGTLNQHKLLHSDSNPFKCEHCGKSFTSKSKINQHKLLHSGSKPYKCEHCGKCFTLNSNLNKHKLIHSGSKPYKCEQCGKCFRRKDVLNEHKLLHSDSNAFKCEHCGKCYTSTSNLNQHKLLHSGSKPYKCESCDKCFSTKSNLNQHILRHSDTKP